MKGIVQEYEKGEWKKKKHNGMKRHSRNYAGVNAAKKNKRSLRKRKYVKPADDQRRMEWSD